MLTELSLLGLSVLQVDAGILWNRIKSSIFPLNTDCRLSPSGTLVLAATRVVVTTSIVSTLYFTIAVRSCAVLALKQGITAPITNRPVNLWSVSLLDLIATSCRSIVTRLLVVTFTWVG